MRGLWSYGPPVLSSLDTRHGGSPGLDGSIGMHYVRRLPASVEIIIQSLIREPERACKDLSLVSVAQNTGCQNTDVLPDSMIAHQKIPK